LCPVVARSLTKKQTADLLEAAIRTEGWSYTLAVRLASQSGYSQRTIYRMKDDLLDKLAAVDAADLPRRRARLLMDVARIRERAVEEGKPAAAARLLDMEAKMTGLDQPQPVAADDDGGELDTSTEGMLAEVRAMRKAAQRGGSHVAAAKLLDTEAGLVADLALERRAANERARSAADPEALEDRIVAALLGMPDKLRRQILARVAE
jgi:hypothetical protein